MRKIRMLFVGSITFGVFGCSTATEPVRTPPPAAHYDVSCPSGYSQTSGGHCVPNDSTAH